MPNVAQQEHLGTGTAADTTSHWPRTIHICIPSIAVQCCTVLIYTRNQKLTSHGILPARLAAQGQGDGSITHPSQFGPGMPSNRMMRELPWSVLLYFVITDMLLPRSPRPPSVHPPAYSELRSRGPLSPFALFAVH
jgi:hypothetical protein